MPTKTEYRQYIASEKWQERRKQFIEDGNDFCARCELPRWLAIVAYDQDLHVHHKSYANVGFEPDEDLQALCKRCHEIKTFGRSSLHCPQKFVCEFCKGSYWDSFSSICETCSFSVVFKEGQFELFRFKWYRRKNWGRVVVRRLFEKVFSV